MNIDRIRQMELRLDAKTFRAARLARRRRRQRAQWWFGQMRRVVNAAIEWQPSPPARPAQVYLHLATKRS